jgi:hypothetical protein
MQSEDTRFDARQPLQNQKCMKFLVMNGAQQFSNNALWQGVPL